MAEFPSEISVFVTLDRLGNIIKVRSARRHLDYIISQALAARTNDDNDYFFNTMLDCELVGAGDPGVLPPSQRGWNQVDYPALNPADIGSLAKDVLIPPNYPLDTGSSWGDPNPVENVAAAYIGSAPDASTAIEIRYLTTQFPQFISAYVPLIPEPGRRHAGMSFEVWTETGFQYPPGGQGKIGAGLWGGSRPSTGGIDPSDQLGITLRNEWEIGGVVADIRVTSSGDIRVTSSGDIRVTAEGSSSLVGLLYSYNFNRRDHFGIETPGVPGVWATGRWQTIEYEGFSNYPGLANGYARMWIDGVCVGQVTRAVFAIDDEWYWRGIIISDSWQDVAPPQNQKRWLRNLRAYYPSS